MTVQILALSVLLYLNAGTSAKPEDDKPAKPLPCDDLQRCLGAGSRACWKRFYDEGRKKEDLIGDVLKVCPEPDFMNFVDDAEAEMWPEFMQVDKNLTDCMSEPGLKLYVDFCSNMRSSKFPDQMEKAIEEAEKAQQKPTTSNPRDKRQTRQRPTGDQGYKCWVTTLANCAEQYRVPSPEIDKALQKCEKELNVVKNEERLGFEVGKRVMLKIVAKIKEVFDKEDESSDKENSTSSISTTSTMKAT